MKIIKVILFGSLFINLAVNASSNAQADIHETGTQLNTVDKILAIIYHPEEASVILLSDLKPSLDGNPKTLDAVIFERLMLLEAKKLKININEGEIDRYLAQLQKENNLTRDDVIKLFKKSGYTYKEGREQLKTLRIVGMLIEERVRSKVIVDQKEIATYYKDHPEQFKKEASYVLTQAIIPCPEDNRAMKRLSINQAIESGEIKDMVSWGPPIELKDSEIQKDVIKEMAEDAVIILDENKDGFELVKLTKKHPEHLVDLEEASREISNTLGKERFDKALKAYESKLMAGARIKYPKDEPEIKVTKKAKA